MNDGCHILPLHRIFTHYTYKTFDHIITTEEIIMLFEIPIPQKLSIQHLVNESQIENVLEVDAMTHISILKG